VTRSLHVETVFQVVGNGDRVVRLLQVLRGHCGRIGSVEMKWVNEFTWSWTNWTFGFWYMKFGQRRSWGIDFGPFEFIRRQVQVKSPGSHRGGKV
jgi:hypothetical protein